MRKTLSNVDRHDLTLKWAYTDSDGFDVFDAYPTAEYREGRPRAFQIRLRPGDVARVEWPKPLRPITATIVEQDK